MKFDRYLREHFFWIPAGLILVFTIDVLILTMGGSIYLMLYVAGSVFLVITAGLFLDYRKEKRIFDEVDEKLELLEKKYLVSEITSLPNTQEAEHLQEILKKTEQSMGDQVASYRREMEDYKAYIETWVHEVKIPISTTKMIMENHKEDPIRGSGLEEEVDRIEQYVEQAMYYSRSSEVEKDYFIREIDLAELVKNTIRKRKKTLISGRASIHIDESLSNEFPGGKKPHSDAKWLDFIIGQVIDNSIKYAKENEPLSLSFRAELKRIEDTDRICLVICDNGIGIKSAELSRVFEKGFTGTNGRRGKASTGIGLYLCRRLCHRLGHDIEVESEEGTGTTTRIIL